ncbi:GNAT family N-acetyltransferase [Aureliella helgolandensis]|uniref:N-acetyltransferase domain-containing protein n=1 Tax=Aureliella helgolandensis TaxID=2527968 RepID=A0A518G6L2_9BACT|nr:GNAT family N-acetyltransferase [Aureliella helgolandensis]QDV24230.1 hypothetical protein Q31a_25450 [Aureliella helgolandensis]
MNADRNANGVTYRLEPDLTVEEFVSVLGRSTLGQRRPVDNLDTIAGMLRGASVILTARVASQLVGVSRAISDFAYCTYLSDLAVDVQYQRQGIGRELMQRTHAAAGLNTTLILLSAPNARSYYPHVGLIQHDSCWTIPPQTAITSSDPNRATDG